MRKKNIWKSTGSAILILSIVLASITIVMTTTASAKSLYVNKDISNSPISAYDIQLPPTYLAYQMTSGTTHYGGVGLAIDTDSEILFVTFEGSNKIAIVNAKTLATLEPIYALNANNLAGIAVDQDNQKVYAVDRTTNHLYVYSWDATAKTLTNDVTTSPFYITLSGVQNGADPSGQGGAHGIALDEVHDLLYVADLSTTVKIFNTADWSSAGTFTLTQGQGAMGIAVDVANGLVYTGHAYPGYGGLGLLSKYDLNTNTETTVNIRTLSGGVLSDNVVGLAVDPATGLLYITTGNQGSGGSDRIIVLDSALTYLHATGDIGNPTGIAIPGKEISYNPLDFQKTDGLSACANAGSQVTYTLSYSNGNQYGVTGATITDTLPSEVEFVSASDGGTLSGNTVTGDIGDIASGDSGSVTLVVTIKSDTPGGTTITNSATIDSDQTPPTTQSETTDTCENQPPVADAGGPYIVNEGSPVVLDASGSTDPDGDTMSYDWDYENDGTYDATGVQVTNTWNDDHIGLILLLVTDEHDAYDTATCVVTVNNVPPTIQSPIAGPTDPVEVNTDVTMTADFTDPGTEDTHTAVWNWGDSTTSSGDVDETLGSGSAEGTHTYDTPGVYTVLLTVTDDDGGSDTETFQYVVIYDQDGGFVTGGGWIDSPAGAYVADPSLTGTANFGFVSKYKKGATTPTGQTEFQFQAGDLNFHSSIYHWLVIANHKAIYKGTGTINGDGNYGFMLFAIDEKLTPSTDVDMFRIKIWDISNNDAVVYDNEIGEAEDAPPTTHIIGGSIVIHK